MVHWTRINSLSTNLNKTCFFLCRTEEIKPRLDDDESDLSIWEFSACKLCVQMLRSIFPIAIFWLEDRLFHSCIQALLVKEKHEMLLSIPLRPPREGTPQNWVGVCGLLPKTLIQFMTKLGDFPCPIYDQKFDTLFMAWPLNGGKMAKNDQDG